MHNMVPYSLICAFAFTGSIAGGQTLRYVPGSTKKICQLTGDFDRARQVSTLSRTQHRFGVAATDLGSSFEHKGKLYFLFGDTWGRPGAWDAVAWTESSDPAQILLHFHKGKDGYWQHPVVPGIEQHAFEVPSYGISIGDTMYVVFTTDHTEDTVMGRSVLACSRDDGKTFKVSYDLSTSHFINVAFQRIGEWIYIYGSGEYRKSSVRLARIHAAEIADKSKLRYFEGKDATGNDTWGAEETAAAPLFQHDQVGEFSVSYLEPVKRYVMLYNSGRDPRGIVMRSSPTPEGQWSEPETVFEGWRDNGYGVFMHISWDFRRQRDFLSDPQREREWGGEYGPYMMSRYTTPLQNGCRIYYTMSTWNPYQVVVMQSDLVLLARLEDRESPPSTQKEHK